MINNLLIAVHVFALRTLRSLSVDEMLLPSYVNSPTYFSGQPNRVEWAPHLLKYMKSVLFAINNATIIVNKKGTYINL